MTSNTNRNLPDRYRQLVAIDLVKESDDIQPCPGEIIIQEKPKTSSHMLTPQAGSPSFNSFLVSTLSTPPSTSSYLNSKLMQSARPIQEIKQTVNISSSFPNTSQLTKKIQVIGLTLNSKQEIDRGETRGKMQKIFN